MISIYHRVCGAPAFLYDHMPSAGEPIRSRHAVTIHGRQITEGSPMVCGSCGKRVLVPPLELAPPPIKVYDMSNTADMQEVYGIGGIDALA